MDDMPKPHFTDMGLRWLDEFGVTATFFIVGRLAERYPDNVRKIVDAGHELGNHLPPPEPSELHRYRDPR